MIVMGTVSSIEANKYRVSINGNISAAIPRLSSAFRFFGDSGRAFPAREDAVLCWFPGEALSDGCILGIVEG